MQVESIYSKNYSLNLAILAILGGIDKRVRLGGVVMDNEEKMGTVEKIFPSGKIQIYMHESKKSCSQLLSQLTPVSVTF